MNSNTFDPFPENLREYKKADAAICEKLSQMGIVFSQNTNGRFFYQVTSTQLRFVLNLVEHEPNFYQSCGNPEIFDSYNLKIRQTIELIKAIATQFFAGKILVFERVHLDNSPVSARCLLNYITEDRKDGDESKTQHLLKGSNIQILKLSVPNTRFHLMSLPTLYQTNIQQLNLDNCDPSQIYPFLAYIESNPSQLVPSLKQLSFVTSSGASEKLSSKHLRSFISFFPNLEQLDFTPKSPSLTTFSDLATFERATTPLVLLKCGHILTKSFCELAVTRRSFFRRPRRSFETLESMSGGETKILACPFCRKESNETNFEKFKPRIFRIKLTEEGASTEKSVSGCIVDQDRKPLDRELILKIHLVCGQITQSKEEDEQTRCQGCFKDFGDQRRRFYITDEPLKYETRLQGMLEDLKS